jgi:hypothetical protein
MIFGYECDHQTTNSKHAMKFGIEVGPMAQAHLLPKELYIIPKE